MPHKRVDARTVERVKEDIAHTKSSIQRIQDLSAFGKDAKTNFITFLKDMAEAQADRRDDIIRQLGLGKVGPDIQNAITWAAAQENAYNNVLDVLADPEKVLKFYRDNLAALEAEQKQYEQFEQAR